MVVEELTPSASPLPSGSVAVDRGGLHIGLGDGAAPLSRVRPAGRASMDGGSYARGARLPGLATWGAAQ